MKRVDTDIEDVIIPVYKLDGFLDPSVHLNLFEPPELADAMINMDYIIARVKACKLLYRDAFLSCEISPDAEFMISVEYLMIGVNRHLQIVVGKPAVKIQKPGRELQVRIDFSKNVVQPVDLRLAFRDNICFVTFNVIGYKLVGQ